MSRALIKSIAVVLAVITLAACSAPEHAYIERDYEKREYMFVGIDEIDSDEYSVESERLVLAVNISDGAFSVTDKKTGAVWHSSPTNIDEQQGLRGAAKNRLLSLVTFSTINFELGNATVRYGNLLYGDAEFAYLSDGFAVRFTSDEGIRFVIEAVITDDYLNIRFPIEELYEPDGFALKDLQILPAFGAGSLDDDGFLLIPDGSGALIRFNNGKKGQYDEPVYGTDKAFMRYALALNKQQAYLPVYGIEKNGAGILAVIHDGAPGANIRAASSGNGSVYNTVYASVTLRNTDSVEITAGVSQPVFEGERLTKNDISIRYYPSDEPGYVPMAETLRNYCITELGMKKVTAGKYGAVLSVINACSVRAKVLGVPLWQTAEPLATFEETAEIAEEINSRLAGGGLAVILNNFDSNTILSKPPGKVDIPGTLGGRGGLSELSGKINDGGMFLFAGINEMTFTKNGGGTNIKTDAVRNIPQEATTVYDYSFSNYSAVQTTARYLLNPAKMLECTDRLVKSLNGLGFYGVAFDGIGNTVYSDFNSRNSSSLSDTEYLFSETLGKAGDAGRVITRGGQLFAATKSEIAMDTPSGSSGFKYADETVPFMQIAFSGITYYTFQPLNSYADPLTAALKSVETGSLLYWELTEQLPENGAYGYMVYEHLEESISDVLTRFSEISQMTAGVKITGHSKTSENIYKTVFENGITVTVDYDKLTMKWE